MGKANIITKLGNVFCKVEKTVTWITFALMLALLLIQVFCRYALQMPLAWAEEMVRYTYIAVSFIGAIVAVRENTHIGIDILPSILDKAIKNKRVYGIVLDCIDVFANLVQLAFFVLLTVWMYKYNVDIAVKNQITTANEWPMWIMCLPVTISFVLMAFHALLNTIEKILDAVSLGKRGVVVNE